MRILVITSCTGEKVVNTNQQLTQEDFHKGCEHVKKREQQLTEHMMPARGMYSGQQHIRLIRGIKGATSKDSKLDIKVDLKILSAGYGLIPGGRKIAPYEVTFSGMKKELREWADQLNIPRDFRKAVSKQYDLVLVLLGDKYLEACNIDESVSFGGQAIIFCGGAAATKLPKFRKATIVPVNNKDAKRFSCGLVGLKGELAYRLLNGLASIRGFKSNLIKNDADILQLLDYEQTASAADKQHVEPEKTAKPKTKAVRGPAIANPKVDKVIHLPHTWQNKPHRKKLRYFIPEWDDLVDPDYDFENDIHSGGGGDWSNEVYAHQMYPEPNYDGILVSKVVAEKSKKKKERINQMGVHRYIRVPRDFPIMGDCGAFGYINEDVPPYSTEEILDYYTRLDFDLGVSVDHLIVSATEAQKKERYQLTINNAEEFLKEHRKQGLPWTPIGAVQGWDPKTYAEAARQYVAMGYKYIAIGGLVRSPTKEILRVLDEVHKVVPDNVDMHLFGLARLGALYDFARLGVRSVDSASYLRQAWMRDSQGYLTEEKSYAAIRVPEIGKSFRAKRMLAESGVSEKKARELEVRALTALRKYDAGKATLEQCVEAIYNYETLFGEGRSKHAERYVETLRDMPWKQCRCDICQRDGIDVIIFRGNNRNRRRGFHNTFVFYRLLQNALNGTIIDYAGSKSKSDETSQLELFTPKEAAG